MATGSLASAADGGSVASDGGRQTTLAGEAEVRGVGFVTGADVTLRLRPAAANEGLVFVRTDLPDRPRVPARIEKVVDRRLRTTIAEGPAVVEMTEHVLAALAGLGVDNCLLELDAAETPGMDGSAAAFVRAVDEAGVATLDAPRRPFASSKPCHESAGDSLIALHPAARARLDVTYNLDYSSNPGIGRQSLMVRITPEVFREEIAPARTFIQERDAEALRRAVGDRVTPRDLLVFRDDGSVLDNRLRFADECVRHKILDVVGDLALLGRPVQGHVLAHKSGHLLNQALCRRLARQAEEREIARVLSERPLLDSTRIEQIIPHRFPFLLVDRVVMLDPNRKAAGIKNVSYNEPFFQGHWPGRPVMPGVLIVEAMAQLAGIALTDWHDHGHYAMIISMNDIKLRRPVVPGDQLWLEAETTRVKSRTATLRTTASVQRELVAEAQMNFVHMTGEDEAAA